MKKFYNILMDCIRNHRNTMDKMVAEKDDLKQKYDLHRITAEVRREKETEINGRMAYICASFRDSVANIRVDGTGYARIVYGVRGDKLTEDAALFSTGIKFTKAEIDAYAEKYKHNPTMLRLIDDYCKKTGIETPGGLMSDVGVVKEWEDCCNKVISQFGNERSYNGLTAALLEQYITSKAESWQDAAEA